MSKLSKHKQKREATIKRILRTYPRHAWVDAIMAETGDDLATTFKAICAMEQRGDLDAIIPTTTVKWQPSYDHLPPSIGNIFRSWTGQAGRRRK